MAERFSPGTGLAFRFARRALSGGLKGFMVFLACIALGVGAIAGVNSLARSLSGGLSAEGRAILGGDIDVQFVQQMPDDETLALLAPFGQLSTILELRAMARSEDGARQTLTEMRAVDHAYPLIGTLRIEGEDGPADLARLLGHEEGRHGIIMEPALAARLALAPGDSLKIGEAQFRLTGLIAEEPDRLSDGFGFGPRSIIAREGLAATGLMQPGSLYQSHTRLLLDEPAAAGLERAMARLEAPLEDKGARLRTRDRASPRLETAIGRFAQFLTLIGLTALIVGGVGVANAVSAYVERKRPVIAAMKGLGAPGPFIFKVEIITVMAIASIGVAIGVVLGLLIPPVVGFLFGDLLPIRLALGIDPGAVGLSVLYGFLVALAFALWPLGRARDVKASELFRDAGSERPHRPRAVYALAALAAIAALALSAYLAADQKVVALSYIVATALSFLILRLVGSAVMALARRLPRVRQTSLRLAIGNIHKPGALTPSVILSLGLGLTLLVALALIDGNLRRELTGTLPEVAPSFFVLDIPSREGARFEGLVRALDAGAVIETVPMLRGRITALKGFDAADYPTPPEAEWVLRGDRGITYAATAPDAAAIVEGNWWTPDYAGPPLVSFVEEEGKALGLQLGDTVTVNVLGRSITATIANFRRVEWGSLSINFAMVFSPNSFAGAPHSLLATIALTQGPAGGGNQNLAAENAVMRAITEALPNVTAVRVKEALDSINALVGDLALAVRGAAAIALIASVLVLGGALAAGHHKRIRDAVILKTLGASRLTILTAFVLEYALLGAFAALFGLAAGSLAAYGVTSFVMGIGFTFLPGVVFLAVLAAMLVTLTLGLVGTFRILGQKAAPVLRNL